MKTVAIVGEWLRINGFAYWRVTHPQNPKMIFLKSQETDETGTNLDLEQSIKFFEDSKKFLNDGQYIILGRKVKNGFNGETVLNFQVVSDVNTSQPEAVKIPEIAGMPNNDLIHKINEINDLKLKHSEERNDWKLKEMQYKRALFEAKNSGKGLDKISGVLGQVISLINHPAVNSPAVSGTKNNKEAETKEMPEVVQIRIGKAINQIADVLGDDEKTIVALEKLAKFAQGSPELFKAYLNTL